MLKKLEIENYILIDHLEIDFFEGFSVITGETGAGKSILLGALELILGNRADTQVLLDKDRKCTIEGVFSIGDYSLQSFFHQNELDYDNTLILRREIIPSGKSRAFINDTPVNLPQLKDLGSMLVNIHSQNSTITLNQSDFQLAVLDSFAGLMDTVSQFRKKFQKYREDERKLQSLLDEESAARAEEDYLKFQHEELLHARLEPDEQQELEETLNLLEHAGEIKENLFHASQVISSDEVNILSLLSEVQAKFKKIISFHSGFAQMSERLESIIIEIKDIAGDVARSEEGAQFDPSELERVRQRLDLIYRLQAKHRVNTVQELIAICNQLESRLQGISSLDEQIHAQKEMVRQLELELKHFAGQLSDSRRKATPAFEKEITALIRHMGMPHARFTVDLNARERMTADGLDKVTFLFNANPGHDLKTLADVASGGELSRVMLAIKAMISQKNLLPTIIFDEIDNGISGDIAGRVGDILHKTSARMQLIAITHLPQIAGRATIQYNVTKKVSDNRTVSAIYRLDPEERVNELARMISGQEISDAARQTARELLNQVSVLDN